MIRRRAFSKGKLRVSDGIDEQNGGEVYENVDINVDNDENVDEMLMMMMFPAAACIAVMR